MKIHDVRQFINSSSEFFTILKQLPTIDGDGPWVAGGSVWKAIENTPLECDIDIFFKSSKQCEEWFRILLSLPFAHRIVSTPKSNQYNTSLKYHVYSSGYNKTITLQLISFKFFNTIEELLNGFDITACQFGFDGQILYTGDTSFDDLRNREIIFNNVLDNVATGIHIEKYTKLGFKIPSSQRQRYDEIMEKTKTFRDRIPSPEPSPGFISRWARDWSVVSTPRPVAVDEDYAYPRPANTGINLSRITEMPIMPIPLPTSTARIMSGYTMPVFNLDVGGNIGDPVDPVVYSTPSHGNISPEISVQNPCAEIPHGNTQTQAQVSPGVYTREIDRSLYTTETISIPIDYTTSETPASEQPPSVQENVNGYGYVGGSSAPEHSPTYIGEYNSQNIPNISAVEEFIGEPMTESNRIEMIRREVESILTPSLAEYSRTLTDEEIL